MQDKIGVFRLEIGWDVLLVNKGLDVLKDKYLVLSVWRCFVNRGMVQMDDGIWKLDVYRYEDDDDEDFINK